MLLAEELLLLALSDDGKVAGEAKEALKFGLSGAMMAELLLMDRVRLVEKGHITVQDDSPTGDELLDEALSAISAREKPRSLKDWVLDLGRGRLKDSQERLARRLVARGVLREEEERILWVFPTRRFPISDPGPKQRVRDRVRGVVLHGDTPDERTMTLLSLIKASKLVGEVFPGDERKVANRRLDELTKEVAAGRVVSKAVEVEEIEAAMAAAVAVIVVTSHRR